MSDAASIHTLAVAVQGILSKVAIDKKVPPSPFMKAVNAQPKKFREWLRNPQNFFKHGAYRSAPKARLVSHDPGMTEMILSDNVGTYNRLFGVSTPLLDLFLFRYSLVFPETKISLKSIEIKIVERGVDLQHLVRLDRIRFLEVVLPLITEIRRDAQEAYRAKKTSPHIKSP